MSPDPRCETCIGYYIDGNQIPPCIRGGCPKIGEYYPRKDALDTRHVLWEEFSKRIKPTK